MLTRMARSASALTACEPVGELTWGELTLACSPSRGTDGLCAFGRSAGLLGRRASRPGLGRARGPAHRAGPQDHLPIGEGSVIGHAHRTGVVGRDRIRLGDGYPGSSCRVLGWSSRWRGSREDPLEFGGLRKVGSIDPGPDLAPWNGVRPARPVYENTGRITRERLVGGIATRKGQASRGPGPGYVIRSHSGSAEDLLAGARLGVASDIRAQRRPVTAWSGIRCTSLHFSFAVTTCARSVSSQQLPFIRLGGDRASSVASRFCPPARGPPCVEVVVRR